MSDLDIQRSRKVVSISMKGANGQLIVEGSVSDAVDVLNNPDRGEYVLFEGIHGDEVGVRAADVAVLSEAEISPKTDIQPVPANVLDRLGSGL